MAFGVGAGCSAFKDNMHIKGTSSPGKNSATYNPVAWKTFFTDSILVAMIDTALTNNPDLLAAYQRIEIAYAQLRAKRYSILPGADARISAGQRRFGEYTMDGVGNYDTRFSPNITSDQMIPEHLPDYFAGMQVSWEIDIWRRLRNSRDAQRARYLQEIEAKNWVISNLVAGIASTYYELLSLDNELLILEDFIRLQEDAELIIGFQKIAGQATELAVQQFQTQTLSSKNMYFETKQKIVDAENRMNVLLGRFPGPVPRNPTAFNDSLRSIPLRIPRTFLRNRPDIVQAEEKMNEAKLNLLIAEAGLYPRLSFDALVGFQSFNAGYLFSPASITYNILAGLTTPIINRAQIKSGVRVAGSSQKTILFNYRKTVLNAYAEVATEIAHLKNLRQMNSLKTREAEISGLAVETANTLFRTGRATYLEVIITQKNALMTKLQLVNLRERNLKAGIRLYKALGGGWR
jgi:multidrug efflux system outer membrane protein